MILGRELTDKERRTSQFNYKMFCAVNGASYMCLGETVLILFAVNLGCPDGVVAILGAMLYIGYLLLPLGKIMTARIGAARSQADFWVMRNISALTVAAAAPITIFISPVLGSVFLLTGAFFFYGFRAAGVVMSQPLVGEICLPEQVGPFLARSWVCFYSCGLVSLLLITWIRNMCRGTWTFFGIIVAGTLLGFTSSTFVRKIDETGQIRNSAGRSFRNGLREVVANPVVRRQLAAGIVCNLCIILTVPISMLTLKRGYLVKDTTGLCYSLLQFAACGVSSYLLSKLISRFGSRRMALVGFYTFFLVALCWGLAPVRFFWPLPALVFVLCSFASVVTASSLSAYFIQNVPREQQVVGSMFIFLGTGAASGILGMLISNGLLKLTAHMGQGAHSALTPYRYYYLALLLLIPILGIALFRLPGDRKA